MNSDLENLKEKVREAQTRDLLDRATVYRAGMEKAALAIIEDELYCRGITPQELEAHAKERERDAIWLPDGTAAVCQFRGWDGNRWVGGRRSAPCYNPAVARVRGWHKLWGVIPLIPCRRYLCTDHLPKARVKNGEGGHPRS
jgi:hypothetical protein